MQVQPNALVQYKKAPAKVVAIDDKIMLALPNGNEKRVRPKDFIYIHPGPVRSLEITPEQPPVAQIEEITALLDGESINLKDLTEFLFEDYTPTTAWSTWELVMQDTYFSGTVESIHTNDLAYAQDKIAAEQEKLEKKQQEEAFLARLHDKKLQQEDYPKLSDIEMLALKQRDTSALFAKIKQKQSPEHAHQWLVSTQYWPPFYNPYPKRFSLETTDPDLPLPAPVMPTRKDLTHLTCLAIDDKGNTDPDDAISVADDGYWVHVADVSTLVTHDSPLDQHAQQQPANLYLPEGTTHMLPPDVTTQLGLGLHETSPALSIRFCLVDQAIAVQEICHSTITVTRMTYAEAERNTLTEYFTLADTLHQIRLQNGAITLDFPEVKMRVDAENQVQLIPLPNYESRAMVMEWMLAAGVACGQYASTHELPFIYSTQVAPETELSPGSGYAAKFAMRKQLSPSRYQEAPEPHAGLGLAHYTQVTSPLRRYADLANHQQLSQHIQGLAPLDHETIKQKIIAIHSQHTAIRKAERNSVQHWKCVYLLQQKNWQGQAHIIALEERKVEILVPELALYAKIKRLPDDQLDQVLDLAVQSVDLYLLEVRFTRQ